MTIFLEFLASIIIWITVGIISYLFTETWTDKPKWIDFAEVMHCYKCNRFWVSIFSFVCLFMITGYQYWYALGLGLILTILTAIGMYIEEKNNTISINDD